jgi:hypothetical protein
VLSARARERGLKVRAEVGDARSFSLQQSFALAIAPMQVVQLLGGAAGREAMVRCVSAHLRAGGVLAVALADPFEGIPDGHEALPPLPDVREQDGWVYSSMPVAVRPDGEATAIDRLRQAVSPAGELAESMATIRLDAVDADGIERAGRELGLRVGERRRVPATADYVGSAVVVLEATS